MKWKLMHLVTSHDLEMNRRWWSADGEWVRAWSEGRIYDSRMSARMGRKVAVKRSGLQDTKRVRLVPVCDDGGRCHHDCMPEDYAEGQGCFRRQHASPLSATGHETWEAFDNAAETE